MPETSRRYLIGLAILLSAGALIGWLYGNVERGLLVAALVALVWHVRHLLGFVQALRSKDFEVFRTGEGVWQQIYSQFSYEHERGNRHKRRYRQLLKEVRKSTDAMPDGAVILDLDNEIVMCNRAAKALVGLKPKKDRGQRVDNILRDPRLTRMLAADDYSQEIEIQSPIHDGCWLNCRLVPYGAEQKLLFLRDITERIRLTRMRRDFVANASHELRSPLTVISGYIDSLADDDAAPNDWVKPVAQMQVQVRRMNHIVAELLELSRLEGSGPLENGEAVNVAALLAAARKAFHRPGETASIEVAAESSAQLRGSSGEIESLITNLLSNAVRHTPVHGQITLAWRADEEGAELCVSDDGEGIEPEHLPRLTERFFRVDSGRAREDGGVGLGLAIVKHVLNRHDGELEIVSERGKGSRFCCRFPSERVVTEPPIPLARERASH
ncbi:MAG: phosphate regulon sensor histidine kinase PhoR [Woeseiaceae bacterium]|nr:phosphate regulon sensor histidine kinase PhoR [Woeseiaceae bacterium]